MSAELKDKSADLKAWMLMHRIRDLGYLLHDRICAEHGLTVEQYTVLSAIKYFDDPVLVGDVARWMGHKVNSASMIADRMFEAGLVDRFRDLPDRRNVRLTITGKGEKALEQATPDMWRLIEDTMSALSAEDKTTLLNLLEKVRVSELQHYSPDDVRTVSSAYETADLSRLTERLAKYAPARTSVANRPDALSPGSAAPSPRPTRAR